ncbi:autotransporter outer membrane beta-barrel domain-containing protein [Veillonella sp. VA142]|uniref:autotransporter outer membrane beta-barrel domain-containing protein n=1 Tax=Veillonella sp. VA142 TaxID=741834 RepID=UPI00197D3235|nr:autotransporter outer membrane beta-barrel domain-containing protein [Veillonella sp. VA142]
MRKRSMMTMGALLAAYALTTSVSYGALQNQTNYTAEETVAGGTDTFIKDGVGVVGGNLTITGPENIDLTMDNKSDESLGINVINGKLTADDLTITVKPGDTAVNNRPKGMIVRGTSTVDIKNLNVTVTKSNRQANTPQSADSDAAYGVAVGYNWLGSGTETNFTVNNANIVVNNTEDTKKGNYTGVPIPGGKFETGYQMSGIRVYRSNGAKPEFHSTGNVNITVEDKSAAKVSDYLVGVYVSGTDAKATFDGDTSITVKANGINSAGIKIGKPGNGDAGIGAQVIANGKLTVDTTGDNGVVTLDKKEYRGSGAVRLFDKDSKFTVTGAKTKEASEIKSSTNAIVFDTFDYKNLGSVDFLFFNFKEVLARGKENVNNEVVLHNTKLSTTSEVDDLVLTNAEFKEEGELIEGAGWLGKRGVLTSRFDWGTKSVKNAKFTLSGEKSEATAAKKGWAIRAKSENADATDEAQRATSELTATIADKAVLTGLIHADKESTLHMNVDKDATWRLAKKEDLTGAQTSTATTVTLSNGGILDAGTNLTDGTKAEYTVATVQKDGTTLSDFKNEGGVITTVNKSYEDVLTLKGNYTGANGIIKMNTKWDSPGDEEGANSVSDLVHITGTAKGSTTVVPVAADGKEAVIDGSIGSITADLKKNTVPVVRADIESSEEGAFTGVAKTTGAGELKLAHRVKEGKHEWFWTLTGLNKTPNLDKRTPGYTQMPEVSTRMIGQILRTLHERRSENPRTLHEQWQNKEYPMSRVIYAHHEDGDQNPLWAKVIKDYGHHDGYRFGYTLHTRGIQLGRDWNVKTKEDGTTSFNGAYVAYQHGQAKFYDNFNTDDTGKQATDLQTGTGTIHNLSLGLTRTKYGAHDQYVDWVGQVSLLRNTYEAVGHGKETQSGWGFAGSVETGRPYVLRETERGRTILEPQGQLVYSYLQMHGIHGTDKVVSHGGHGTLVGRIGARLSREKYNANGIASRTIYGVANIWRTFTNAYAVHIGDDTLRGDYGRTIGELGIGAQWRKDDRWYVYGDVRFERNLGGSYYKGYRGNVGIKYIW